MSLINKESKEYGDKFNEHILEQWKTVVEMANCTSDRRINNNNFFILINTGLIAFMSLEKSLTNIIIYIVGIVISVVWICSIKSYKKMNKMKFKIINELEDLLPTSPHKYEWEIVNKNKKYKRFTALEMWLPSIFIFVYVIFMIINICGLIY